MREFVYDNFEHVLCLLILVGRLGDILSTFIATPTLRLEANLLAKKLGRPFMWLSVLACLIPYYSTELGVIVLVPSLMVSASNIGKIWFVRSIGEDQYIEILYNAVRRGKLWHALVCVVLSSFFIGLTGFTLLLLEPEPEFDWGFWFAFGIMSYASAILIHGTTFFIRLFKKVKQLDAQIDNGN